MPVHCKDCGFWALGVLGATQKKGECRRYPPKIKAENSTLGYWPIVRREDWCGEGQDKNIIEEMEKARQRKIEEMIDNCKNLKRHHNAKKGK